MLGTRGERVASLLGTIGERVASKLAHPLPLGESRCYLP